MAPQNLCGVRPLVFRGTSRLYVLLAGTAIVASAVEPQPAGEALPEMPDVPVFGAVPLSRFSPAIPESPNPILVTAQVAGAAQAVGIRREGRTFSPGLVSKFTYPSSFTPTPPPEIPPDQVEAWKVEQTRATGRAELLTALVPAAQDLGTTNEDLLSRIEVQEQPDGSLQVPMATSLTEWPLREAPSQGERLYHAVQSVLGSLPPQGERPAWEQLTAEQRAAFTAVLST